MHSCVHIKSAKLQNLVKRIADTMRHCLQASVLSYIKALLGNFKTLKLDRRDEISSYQLPHISRCCDNSLSLAHVALDASYAPHFFLCTLKRSGSLGTRLVSHSTRGFNAL